MADEQNPHGGQPQAINLQQMAQQFMAGLQRHFDMLAFNLASRESATEEAYKRRVHDPKIMPAAAAHVNFEQMQAYARDLMIRQVIGDSLNLCVSCMNNAHLFLAAVKARRETADDVQAGQKLAQSLQQQFATAQLDDKFNRLEKDFGIMCELEDTVISLAHVLQSLLRQGGVIKAAQLDGGPELVIDLKTVLIQPQAAAGTQPQARIVDLRKSFREGEAVVFSDRELQLILVTVASFADSLFKAVAEYARSAEDPR